MITKLSILAVTVLYFLAPSVSGQDCVPGHVRFLTITANSVLQWEVDPDEPCAIDEFLVDIEGDSEDEYHFRVNVTSLDVSFLGVCELWNFLVTPFAAGVEGSWWRFVDYVPLPPSADLSLKYVNVTHLAPREIRIDWDLANRTYGDCTLWYGVVVEDRETGDIQDIYVASIGAFFNNLSPCVSYEISVRAINSAQPIIEGPISSLNHDMPVDAEAPPTLNSVDLGATTADILFNLEGFNVNRCPVRTLYVDGGNFNISVPLTNTEGERPPVEVNLKGLRPDSMYLLRVSVENSGGISPPGQIAVQTLPLDPGRL